MSAQGVSDGPCPESFAFAACEGVPRMVRHALRNRDFNGKPIITMA